MDAESNQWKGNIGQSGLLAIRCLRYCIRGTVPPGVQNRVAGSGIPPSIPKPEPVPPRDPEPEPGSDPDVIPPINPDPAPDTFPPVRPEPEPMPV